LLIGFVNGKNIYKTIVYSVFFLVPTRWRGNELATRQRRVTPKDWTLARPEWVPTPARGNQKKRRRVGTRKKNLSGLSHSHIV